MGRSTTGEIRNEALIEDLFERSLDSPSSSRGASASEQRQPVSDASDTSNTSDAAGNPDAPDAVGTSNGSGSGTATSSSAQLLRHPKLWRARELGERFRRRAPADPSKPSGTGEQAIATGFDVLDSELLEGGWPRAGLTELLCPGQGVGELRLLAPALRTLSRTEPRWLVWVNPPHVPYAPALAAAGIDVDKILLIHPRNHREALWSLEQALKSGTCSAALGWLNETELKPNDLRRLQLAAKTGRTWANLFRPRSAANHPSMAELRLCLEARPSTRCDRMGVAILKRRGGWPVPEFEVVLEQRPVEREPQVVRNQLELWRNLQRQSRLSQVETAADSSGSPVTLEPVRPPLPLDTGVETRVLQ